MEDLIRRSDALSCFHDLVSQRGDHALLLPIYGAIANLPSALPKPHGRLIDGDYVAETIAAMIAYHKSMDDAFWLVENAPTIIEAEEGE